MKFVDDDDDDVYSSNGNIRSSDSQQNNSYKVPCVHGGWPVGPAAGMGLLSAAIGSLRAPAAALPPVANAILWNIPLASNLI